MGAKYWAIVFLPMAVIMDNYLRFFAGRDAYRLIKRYRRRNER